MLIKKEDKYVMSLVEEGLDKSIKRLYPSFKKFISKGYSYLKVTYYYNYNNEMIRLRSTISIYDIEYDADVRKENLLDLIRQRVLAELKKYLAICGKKI